METEQVKPPYTFWQLVKDALNWLFYFWLLLCLFSWSTKEGTQQMIDLLTAVWKLVLAVIQQVAHVIKTA